MELLLRHMAPEMCIFKAPYRYTSMKVEAHCVNSLLFVTTSNGWKGYPISPFLLNLAKNDVFHKM